MFGYMGRHAVGADDAACATYCRNHGLETARHMLGGKGQNLKVRALSIKKHQFDFDAACVGAFDDRFNQSARQIFSGHAAAWKNSQGSCNWSGTIHVSRDRINSVKKTVIA